MKGGDLVVVKIRGDEGLGGKQVIDNRRGYRSEAAAFEVFP
jgi:hypothetical protein